MIGFGQKALFTQIIEEHLRNTTLDTNKEIIIKIKDLNIMLVQDNSSEFLVRNAGQKLIDSLYDNQEEYKEVVSQLNESIKTKFKIIF
jgi:hypothetical protein